MDNHFWKNLDFKILSMSLDKLEQKLHSTRAELGQTAATKLSPATGAVSIKNLQSPIFSNSSQLLMAKAVNPSYWILFSSE